MSSGSYRIWVHDLSLTFSEIGVISKVVNSVEDVEADADIIILCKSCYRLCEGEKQSIDCWGRESLPLFLLARKNSY